MHLIVSLAGVALMLAGTPFAGQQTASTPPVTPGPVVWLEPSAALVAPQSDAEKEAGMKTGRPLPTPELLQPSLDPALPHFVPTPGLKIDHTYRAGSSDVMPALVEGWARAFQQYQPGFKLDVKRPLAGSLGALELVKGDLDVVFVSRELKPSDISAFHARFGYEPFSVPISGGSWRHFGFLDAIGIVVNPQNPVKQLDYAQLDAAFSTTRFRGGKPIRTWGDLGLKGAWADRPVHLYGIKPWNGFEEFVRQRVLSTPGHRGNWRSDIHFDDTFFDVARRVAADPDALGYTGLSAIDSQVKIVPISVAADGAPASPDYEHVAAASYPLSRVTYFNTNARSGRALDPALREFLRFILSREGQAVVREEGIFLPLRANQVAASRAYLDGGPAR